MNDKFLIVNFHDNDFNITLDALGKYLLSDKFKGAISSKDLLKRMNNDGCINEVLTLIFRNLLFLSQSNIKCYGKFNNIDDIIKQDKLYHESDYYNLSPVFTNKKPKEDMNGECLVIDFDNNYSYVL